MGVWQNKGSDGGLNMSLAGGGVSQLLGKHSTTWAMTPALFALVIFQSLAFA
jgi:hypothetical protein